MLTAYLKLMRPADWVKNLFILPALVFSIPSLEAAARTSALPGWLAKTCFTVVAFSLLAAGFYAINDSLDCELDRKHPRKRNRPIACGQISPSAGFRFGVMLVCIGILTGFFVEIAVGGVLLAYLLLQCLYNGGLKRIAIVDAVVLATGFGMRATAGAFAIERAISSWLLGCVFFLTLYLAFIKRLSDLSVAELESVKAEGASWLSPAGYEDRLELNWLLGVSGVSVILSWVFYSLSLHAMNLFGRRSSGFAMLTPLVLVVVHRFYRRASRGERDSPMDAMREDRVILISLVLFGGGVLACLYVPAIEHILSLLIFDAPRDRDGA
ncbi:MAG: UbiA prenyltransferase family protein [Rubripirellula sp.]|nr:UbiA prenyltransferase family protein [Rubripirellula sp.]